MRLRLDTLARRIDVPGRKLTVTGPGGAEDVIGYDELVIGTGAVPARPPIAGLDALGPGDGVHLLHSMDDTFAIMRTLEDTAPDSAVIVGAGYIGLEMADALTARGLAVTQRRAAPRGAAHRRRPARRPGPRRTGSPRRDRAHRHRGAGDQPRRVRRARPAARRGGRGRRRAGHRARRACPGGDRGPPGNRPRRQRRGQPRRPRRDRCGPGYAHGAAGRLRGRRLRDHPPPAARRDLPAARHHRAQAGPGRGGERGLRQPRVRRQPRHPGRQDLRPRRRPHRTARPRSHRRRIRPGHRPAPRPTTTRPITPAATAST